MTDGGRAYSATQPDAIAKALNTAKLVARRHAPLVVAPTPVGESVCATVGIEVGAGMKSAQVQTGVGMLVGDAVGPVGALVGALDGATVGMAVGRTVGALDGATEGLTVGCTVGVLVGLSVGATEGRAVGDSVGTVGVALGITVGAAVGMISQHVATVQSLKLVPHVVSSGEAMSAYFPVQPMELQRRNIPRQHRALRSDTAIGVMVVGESGSAGGTQWLKTAHGTLEPEPRNQA
eukprot:CAMPEP_0117560042 /NCGR_PEP_ID=MMETSP0784-20121206/53671_1 /TAXON_ID=39447 /ORGANISM="" /LENGTH=234 /DNA_ID=CAMNT_0005357437 /DNA_START=58 /DNA_END=763 /DNA_ORIENTATION=+